MTLTCLCDDLFNVTLLLIWLLLQLLFMLYFRIINFDGDDFGVEIVITTMTLINYDDNDDNSNSDN